MKQIIPFEKEIEFRTNIYEISSISLEHTLHLSEDIVEGEFLVSGQYKENINTNILEDFYFHIPCEIAIDGDYDLSNIKIDIEDFYYEITNNNILKINIDIAIDGLEERQMLSTEDDIFNKEDNMFEEEKIEEEQNIIEEGEDIMEEEREDIENDSLEEEKEITSEVIKEKVTSLFDSFDDRTETFSTYAVYIVREGDTLESILTKYNKTREEIEEYNNLDDFRIGTKLIIPASIKYE